MTITAAQILTKVNANLNRNETDIDDQIKEILQDIGNRDDFIKSATTMTATDSATTTAAPSLMKRYIELYITGGEHLREISYEEYREWMQDQSSPIESEPEEFALLNDTFYWKPVPNTGYTVQIDYYKYHAESTTVEFPDRFRAAVYAGVTMAVARDENLKEQLAKYLNFYEAEITKLKGLVKRIPTLVRYRDI